MKSLLHFEYWWRKKRRDLARAGAQLCTSVQPCELFIIVNNFSTPAKWKNYCDHVQHIEQERKIDEFVIRLGEDDNDSSSSDSSDNPSDPESDEELALPLPMDTDTSTATNMFSK
ncbi:hypothetical protein J6590_034859 [Homalodisca vitripennis]|nr:hypothetical protein J6590_034859 [Homalodisca vitripennis]